MENKGQASTVIFRLAIVLMWIIELSKIFVDITWYKFGILPRKAEGLFGIIMAPFIHGDLFHLISNTIPLVILGYLIYAVYRKVFFNLLLYLVFILNIIIWIFGRQTYHIGASGLVYGMLGFLISSGFFTGNRAHIQVGFAVFFLYGGTLYGLFPTDVGISWESHLLGFVVGVLSAYRWKDKVLGSSINNTPPPVNYTVSEHDFRYNYKEKLTDNDQDLS